MRDYLLECYRWWRTWKTFPVKAWIAGARHYRKREFALAAQCYLSGLEKFPFHPAAYSALLDYSHCLFKTGSFKDAQDGLRLAIARDSRRREAYVRLARIQLWCGQLLDAAWTARRALQSLAVDSELLALFIMAVVENGGPDFLLKEAERAEDLLIAAKQSDPLLELAILRMEIFRQPGSDKFRDLEKMALSEGALFEALLAYAEILLRKRRTIEARDQLRKVLQVVPTNPRVLSLLAESYLNDPSTANPDYAVQLASQACQQAGWLSARELHVLAAAHQRKGDKVAALLTASKAREEGSRLLGSYSELRTLDQLISDLSTGTLG